MERSAKTRFDMPALFGASRIPDRTSVPSASALVLSFETNRGDAGKLVPGFFELPERPIVTVSMISYQGVDYLGGRSYNEVVVSVTANYNSADETISAAFATVLWVDQVGALTAGREFMGLAKLHGVIPDARLDADVASFRLSEYDALLIQGEAQGLRALQPEKVSSLNERAGNVQTFGWKYIASAEGPADADYPLVNSLRWAYTDAWTGKGSLRFLTPGYREAPFSSGVMAVLASLPITGDVRAFRGVGSVEIDRLATRRLASTGSGFSKGQSIEKYCPDTGGSPK